MLTSILNFQKCQTPDPETKSTTFELQGYEKATLHIYINDKLTKEQNITF